MRTSLVRPAQAAHCPIASGQKAAFTTLKRNSNDILVNRPQPEILAFSKLPFQLSAMDNLYKILGVKDFATAEEIKTAYRKLSKKFHPDMNEGDDFFANKFKEIQNAYEILSDINKKSVHDAKLRNQSSSNSYSSSKQSTNTASPPPKPASTQASPKSSSEDRKEEFLKLVGGVIAVLTFCYYFFYIRKGFPNANKTETAQTEQVYNYLEDEDSSVEETEQNENNFSTEKKINSLILEGGQMVAPVLTNNIHHFDNDIYVFGNSGKLTFYKAGQGVPLQISSEIHTNAKGEYNLIITKEGIRRLSQLPSMTLDELKGVKNVVYKSNIAEVERENNASKQNSSDYYTLGSSKDEVLAIQGQPDDIIGNTWYYNSATVRFSSGQVSSYSNSNNTLKIKL